MQTNLANLNPDHNFFFDLGSKVPNFFGHADHSMSHQNNTFITKLPPPPGFIPPTLPPRVSLNTSSSTTVVPSIKVSQPPPVITPTKLPPTISVLNPQPAMTKPSANYKLTPSPTRSILRQNLTKKSNFRVSFDLELTDPQHNRLAPKLSNPSMPDLSKLIKEAEALEEEAESIVKNPFLDPAFKIPPNETVKLGETFFTNLFLLNTNDHTTTFTDPWSATKKVPNTPKTPASAPASSVGVMTPASNSASKGLEQGQRSIQEDKYSALKELDDVFKSTVVLSDGKSTGTSIFGSSPMTSQPDPPPLSTSVFGPSPTNIAANGSSGLDNFPTNWGSSGDNNITAAPIGNVQF